MKLLQFIGRQSRQFYTLSILLLCAYVSIGANLSEMLKQSLTTILIVATVFALVGTFVYLFTPEKELKMVPLYIKK